MKKILKKVLKKAAEHKKLIKLLAIELFFIALLIVADLLTKVYIYGAAKTGGDIPIIKGVIKFVAEDNTGASFGMLKDSTFALAIFSAICTTALLSFLVYTINNRHKLFRAALILIIGGAAGNLYDRFALGYVRDFVYFELINYAVFNFADSALTVGCIMFLIYVIFYYNEKSGFSAKEKAVQAAKDGIMPMDTAELPLPEESNKDAEQVPDNLENIESNLAEEKIEDFQEPPQDNG